MDYFTWPDYLILVAFFVISLGIGVYHSLTGGRQKTTTEFILANRSLKVIPTSLSLLVSYLSAIMILGNTAEMYSYGSMYLLGTLISVTLAIVLSILVAVPWLYPLKLVSVNEYLERRFHSKSVRILASTISIFSAILYMGAAMYAPSAALQAATGVPILFSIPVMAVVSLVYTALGGMRAVIWTDVFQSVIIFGGLLAILIKGLIVVGGFGNVIQLYSQAGRMNWIDWSPDPTVRHTIWGFVFGFTMLWFNFYGLSQSGVQRYSAIKTLSQAKLTIILILPAFYIMHLIICFIGFIVVAYYASIRCDPLANGDIGNANQLLPRFVLQMFADAPGFAGIFLVALYGAALSTVSTSLSGSAANCWEDILQWKLKHWTESRKALLNRFLVVFFGIAATGLAFIASVVPGPITQVAVSLLSATYGPICGLYVLGGFNRYANWKGALIGGITGVIGSFWMILGTFMVKLKPPTLPPLSIDGCMNNLTIPNYDDSNSSSIFHFVNESPINETMTYFRPQANETIEVPLQGLEKFYSISYLWYNTIWILVTVFVGSIASLLLNLSGNRSLEEKVDEKLLFSFMRCFQCRDVVSESKQQDPKISPIGNNKTIGFHIEGNESSKESYLRPTPDGAFSDGKSIEMTKRNSNGRSGELVMNTRL